MAINAYTGLMGSGKSYEVVENVILPALLAGRRVVTNVAGLQIQDIYAYLIEKFDADPANLGTVVQCSNEQIPVAGFFPVEVKDGEVAPPSIVQGGDLVVVDECWRWWATGCKILPAHMTFFRMHRHFVNAITSGTCDIVLIVQDISDLDRKIKVVVENTYRMSKHKLLGTSKRYRVDVYPGYKIAKGTPKIREMQRAYNPDIFKLYASYSQSAVGGKEGAIDKRANIWRGAIFSLVLPVLFIFCVVAAWLAYRFFHPTVPKSSSAVSTAPGARVGGAAPVPVQAGQPAPSQSESAWRVTGDYLSSGNRVVVLRRGDSTRVLINPDGFFFDGLRVTGSLNGQLVSNFTGAEPVHDKPSYLGQGK
jgi:zona occludens toxin